MRKESLTCAYDKNNDDFMKIPSSFKAILQVIH